LPIRRSQIARPSCNSRTGRQRRDLGVVVLLGKDTLVVPRKDLDELERRRGPGG